MVKLNIQGLSRRYEPLMSCLIVDPGKVFISVDLSSGEPTVISHFSKDPRYYAACFGMVGKAPYYDSENILNIDDIYLMGMSVSPMGHSKMKELYNTTFDGNTFSEQWLLDSDVIKSQIKDERAFHKILMLGLGYSMGPKHMVQSAYKAGYSLSLKDAKAFFNTYWKELFPGVEKLAKLLELQYKKQGYLINPFGYRLIPEPSYKALNYFIQSSVSGIMNVLCTKFFTICEYAEFVTIIHDEVLFQIPQDKVEDAKLKMQSSFTSLNDDLQWSVKLRGGFVEGINMYEAK